MKQCLLMLIVLLPCVFTLPGCDDSEDGFGIFLADSGERVLSEDHIAAYDAQTHVIELNREGIEKWNAYMTYSDIPRLHQTLYEQEFVVKVKGEEVYRGKFWSMLSSSMYEGVIILESLFKLDDERNTIQIQFGYPWPQSADAEDPRGDPRVLDFFEKEGKLRTLSGLGWLK